MKSQYHVSNRFLYFIITAVSACVVCVGASEQDAISRIGHSSVWPHIGSPPPAGAGKAGRAEAWAGELKAFSEGAGAIKESWTGFASTAGDLRFKVHQYESLIRTLTESGGYGNLILASTARQLSDALLADWAVRHVSESGVARDLIGERRVHLLDCPATNDMITEETEVVAPPGGWRLSDRGGPAAVFNLSHSNSRNEFGRLLLAPATPTKLMMKSDLNGLIGMLVGVEVVDQTSLPTLLEFERLGGDPADLHKWEEVMDQRQHVFPFPALGEEGGLGAIGHVGALIQRVKGWQGQSVPFSAIVSQ